MKHSVILVHHNICKQRTEYSKPSKWADNQIELSHTNRTHVITSHGVLFSTSSHCIKRYKSSTRLVAITKYSTTLLTIQLPKSNSSNRQAWGTHLAIDFVEEVSRTSAASCCLPQRRREGRTRRDSVATGRSMVRLIADSDTDNPNNPVYRWGPIERSYRPKISLFFENPSTFRICGLFGIARPIQTTPHTESQ